jgi:hypothetical protein
VTAMTAKVLLVGRDDDLLQSRARIVERYGVETICCGPEKLSIIEPDRLALAILCHTLAWREALDCAARIQTRAPGARVVTIRAFWDTFGERTEIRLPGVDEIPAGPEVLARYMSGLLERRAKNVLTSNPARLARAVGE